MEAKKNKYLKAGTVLVPKPEYKEQYDKSNWFEHIVTKEEEEKKATIGERWMIKPLIQ